MKTAMEAMNRLVLVVSNVKKLQPTMEAKMLFSTAGGNIGSNKKSDWFLQDDIRSIAPNHCQIFMSDDAFCLKDLCGRTYINTSNMTIGINKNVQLKHKDEIQIGEYIIRVYLNEEESFEDAHRPLEEFFNDGHVALLEDDENFVLATFPDKDRSVTIDPILALDESTNKKQVVKDKDENLSDLLSRRLESEEAKPTLQSDSEFELTSSMRLKQSHSISNQVNTNSDNELSIQPTKSRINKSRINIESNVMDENELEILEREIANGSGSSLQIASSSGSEHLVMAPIFNGLQVPLENNYSIEKVHKMGEEIGATLRVCVEQILDINNQMMNSRFGVVHKNSQPIEDNPLRLSLDYAQTVKTLFGDQKSVVQLSAPAAMEESLNNIKNHNQATQEAISDALSQMLMAFSPEVLLRRFNKYKSIDQDTSSQNQDAWAWDMYQKYFEELTSNRQTGFDKLFWEIFEHSYDQKIREMQRES